MFLAVFIYEERILFVALKDEFNLALILAISDSPFSQSRQIVGRGGNVGIILRTDKTAFYALVAKGGAFRKIVKKCSFIFRNETELKGRHLAETGAGSIGIFFFCTRKFNDKPGRFIVSDGLDQRLARTHRVDAATDDLHDSVFAVLEDLGLFVLEHFRIGLKGGVSLDEIVSESHLINLKRKARTAGQIKTKPDFLFRWNYEIRRTNGCNQ